MTNGHPVDGSVFIYAPNKIAPIVFAVAFWVSSSYHLGQCIFFKSFKITALHPFCCLLFTVGFALREWGAFDYDYLNVYIASTVFIYCAPPVLELANYHILGRILYYVPYNAPLHPGRTLTTFGFLSGLVEVLNAIGVTYLSNKNYTETVQNLGHILMKISLILQVVVICLFCIIAGLFHRRCIRSGVATPKVSAPLWTLYISTALIMVRTIYRIIEHFTIDSIPRDPSSDYDPMSISPILRYEWFFYVFEASLMLINTTLWNIRHPRRYLPEDYHIYLAQDGKTELQGQGWKSDRPWLVTFMDPFDFIGMAEQCTGSRKTQKKERPFWETNGFAEVTPLAKGNSSEHFV